MPRNAKIRILVLAALVAVLAYEGANGPTAKHVNHDVRTETESAPELRASHGTRSYPHVRPVLGEGSSAIASVQGAQAGSGATPPPMTEPSTAPDPDDDGLVSEEDSIYSIEPSPLFMEWRKTWSDEAPDPTWEPLRSRLAQWVGSLRSPATLHQIDCRETICQLYLHVENVEDAQAIFASMSRDRVQAEHEQLADDVQLEHTPSGGSTYELVIKRDRPASLPPHVPGAMRAYSEALAAREGIE